MRTSLGETSALRPLAEAFFRQVRLLGLLSLPRLSDPSKNRPLAKRLALFNGFFQGLEAIIGLTFEQDEVALLYNTQTWPDDAPPAGWSHPGSSALPSHLVMSYSAYWIGNGFEENRPGVRRLLKAGAWFWLECRDLARMIEYLFALLRQGIVLDPYDVARAVTILLNGWRSVDNDEQVPQSLFQGNPPRTPKELFDADPAFTDDSRLVRPTPPEILEGIVEIAESEISAARAATNYDDWFVGQARLERVLRAVKQTLNRHAPSSSGLDALLDQYEEMYCDGGAVQMAAGVESYVETYVHTFQKLFTMQGKRDRLRTERAIVPDAIADELLGYKPLPSSWLAFSPAVAAAFAMVHMDDGAARLPFLRSRPFTADEIEQSPRALEVLAQAGLASEEERRAAVFDLLGVERPASLVSAKVAELFAPSSGEPGAEDSGQKRKLEGGDLAHPAALDEVNHLFHAAVDGPEETRIRLLQEAADLYPWLPFFHMELAIAYDTLQQDPARALQHITTALILDPDTDIHWHSFGVICGRLALEREAQIAAAVKEWVKASNS
jgi:hypothetical protein